MSRMNRDEFLKSVDTTPRTHEIEQSILDGEVGRDNRGYVVDKVSHVSPEGITWSIKNVSHKSCDLGHLQSQKVRFLGKCQKNDCGKITCTTEGCGYTCRRCGKTYCRGHVSVFSDGQSYCSDCKWFKYLAIAFALIKKVVK